MLQILYDTIAYTTNHSFLEINYQLLMSLMYNLFVNDLVVRLNSLDIGVDIGGEKVTALLYADDLALVASSEHDLQILLNELNDWCTQNNLTINQKKSNIVHFRPTDERKSEFTFRCGDKILDIVPQYIYLGLLLTEDMCYDKMAKHVCKATNRALGLVIAKSKVFGGFNFETFSKLYDSMVWSVMECYKLWSFCLGNKAIHLH